MAIDFDAVELFPVVPKLGRLQLSWASTAAPGSWFQVYVDRRLAESTPATVATIPAPGDRVEIVVGAVPASERDVDHSGSLPGAPADRASLSWLGGSYLDPTGGRDVSGFRVYAAPSAGAPVDFSRPVADLEAYPGGEILDGYGLGGFGQGGFGRSATRYRWSSGRLGNGAWAFAVQSYDKAGNEAPPISTTVAISAPPLPPPLDGQGRRVWYTYDPATGRATLHWLAAPEA